jgi:hypothetical protein
MLRRFFFDRLAVLMLEGLAEIAAVETLAAGWGTS